MGTPHLEIYLTVDVFIEGFHFWLLLLIDFLMLHILLRNVLK